MHFGIVVTTEKSDRHVLGLLSAAVDRGWTCRCFLTDRGVQLLGYQPFMELLVHSRTIQVNVCEHSWETFGWEMLRQEPAVEQIQMGSQYQNAELVHECDKVLVL